VLLILGAGYLGAAMAARALEAGEEVVLADNWYATDRRQLDGLGERGARIETADLRRREDLDRLLGESPSRVYLLAAQASRPISEREPDYTEQTNVTGVRHVAEAVADAPGRPPIVFASSLNVYGDQATGHIGPDHPYGPQGDLAHLSKVYGELCLALYARRARFGLHLARLAIVFGLSPVEHEGPDSQTVVDKFRGLAAAGRPLTVDAGGRATIGVVHVDDAARILLELDPADGVAASNVVAESITVGALAALVEGRPGDDPPARTYETPYEYRHRLAEYLAL
jgi:nucleoside-diphosphate-sugar epimerase